MAAKKKTTTSSPNDGKGTKAQMDALMKSKTNAKPTEAITNKGQKATGLAKPTVKDRFSSTAKTPVHNATTGLRGSGTPLGTSIGINPLNKKQMVNTALVIATAPSIGGKAVGPVTSAVVKKVEKYVGGKSLPVIAKGLEASGAGGKLYGALTPEGTAIASTRIGSAAQQGARMGNLMKGAVGKSEQIASAVGNDVARGMNAAGKIVKTGAAGKLLNDAMKTKTKPKKK